jgi:autotransporter-associated beta strand protein
MNLTTQGYPGAYCGSAPNASFAVEGLMLLGCGTSIGALSGSGSVGLYRQSDPLLIGGVSSGFFSGRLSNAQFGGSVICCGSGEQTFSGASTMFGYVLISAGSLLLNGATFATNVQFTVQGGAGFRPTLGGFGTFGPTIVTDGNLALDSVRGQFGLARFPSLQLAPSATLTYEIKGATPGTGFTQLVVNGDTFLDSALLSVDFNGYQPATGQSITLLTGATALFDTFRNAADESLLPEGAVLSASGMKFTITYKGGTGRDVVITRQAGTPATPGPTPKPTLPFKRFLPMVSGG